MMTACSGQVLRLSFVVALCGPSAGQGSVLPDAWLPPFDHDMAGFDVLPHNGETFHSIHMALIPKGPMRGRLFLMDADFMRPAGEEWAQRWSIMDVSDPANPVFENFTLGASQGLRGGDLFCAGHTWTHDGQLLIAGGTTQYGFWVGGKLTYLFNPELPTNAGWKQLPDLQTARWYPTVHLLGSPTALGSYQYLVLGGLEDHSGAGNTAVLLNDYEVYHLKGPDVRLDPRLYKGPSYGQAFAVEHRLSYYPRIHTLEDGSVFRSGFTDGARRKMHVTGEGVVGVTGSDGWQAYPVSRGFRVYGSSILFPNLLLQDGTRIGERIMLIGGRANGAGPPQLGVEHMDVNEPTAHWVEDAPLNQPRSHQNVVILPDGSIFVVGGRAVAPGEADGDPDDGHPVMTPELFRFDVATQTGSWSDMPDMDRARTYHAAAMLLPSGQVLIGGGDDRDLDFSNDPPTGIPGPSDYQIYSPPYLTSGAPRPQIVSHPERINYGGVLTIRHRVTGSSWVEKVVLMRPGSVTHHQDYDQRYIELDVLPRRGRNSISVKLGTNRNSIPPGYYMLFLVSGDGVPSVASWIQLPY